tara:strand:- start:26 stop:301 length:276 start_codon:yes stop_codon:yes gene_type:complete
MRSLAKHSLASLANRSEVLRRQCKEPSAQVVPWSVHLASHHSQQVPLEPVVEGACDKALPLLVQVLGWQPCELASAVPVLLASDMPVLLAR